MKPDSFFDSFTVDTILSGLVMLVGVCLVALVLLYGLDVWSGWRQRRAMIAREEAREREWKRKRATADRAMMERRRYEAGEQSRWVSPLN